MNFVAGGGLRAFLALAICASALLVACSANNPFADLTVDLLADGSEGPIEPGVSLDAAGAYMLKVGVLDARRLTRVDVYHNDALLRTITTPPFEVTVDFSAADNGAHRFHIVAQARSGQTYTSAPVEVIVAINSAPVAQGERYTVTEGGTLERDAASGVLANDSDVDGAALEAVLVDGPAHGSLDLAADGSFSYAHDGGEGSADAFSYKVSDGELESEVRRAEISVDGVNDAPTAAGRALATDEDSPLELLLEAEDPEGGALTYQIVDAPARGSLSGEAPALTYTPDKNFYGEDSLSFRVSDGELTSGLATLTIAVAAKNDKPVADDQSVALDEDTEVAVVLSGSDQEGDALTFRVTSGPANGTLTGEAPNLTYTPAPDFFGEDAFTFVADDGDLRSRRGTVSVTVAGVNDPPTATSQALSLDEDIPLALALTAADPDGDALVLTLGVAPQHGAVSGAWPDLTYTPDADYAGDDRFTYTVSDAEGASPEAEVTLTVAGVNDAPVVAPGEVATDEDTAFEITLVASDVDSASVLAFTVEAAPGHGELGLPRQLDATSAAVLYTPSPDFNGADSFSVSASDGEVSSEVAVYAVEVRSVEDVPVAEAATVELVEDTPVSFGLAGRDGDGDPITFRVVTPPGHGQLSGTAPALTYRPNPDFVGEDSFTFVVEDGKATSAEAAVTLTVEARSDPPVALAPEVPVAVTEDVPQAVVLEATDPDSPDDTLTFEVVRAPDHGRLDGSAPNLTYVPDENYHGPDAFDFKVVDQGGNLDVATVELAVAPVNDEPVPTTGAATTLEDTPLELTLTASDVDGDPLEFVVFDPPSEASPVLYERVSPGVYRFSPIRDYHGTVTIGYSVSDLDAGGQMLSSVRGAFDLTVQPVNDAPVAYGQEVTTAEDEALAVTLSASDVDGDTLGYRVVSGPQHGALSGEAPALLYTPAADYFGADSFSFVADDGQLDSEPVTVDVTVTPVNDAPTIGSAEDQSVVQNTGPTTTSEVSVSFDVADIDNGPGELTVTASSSAGAIVATADLAPVCSTGRCTLTFPVTRTAAGSATITLTVADPDGLEAASTFAVTVAPRLVLNAGADGAGSLLATLAAAEADDVVAFADGVGGTVAPAETVILDKNVTLYGPGEGALTLSGAGARRVLEVRHSVTASLSGLTIADGLAPGATFATGGGVHNLGTLSLTGVTLSRNSADRGGALSSDNGILTLDGVTVTGNTATSSGGGLFATGPAGSVTVRGSTFSGNLALEGAGLYTVDTAVLVDASALTGNGNNQTQTGAGVFNERATLTLRDSTVRGNVGTNQLGGAGTYRYEGVNDIDQDPLP